MAEKYQEQLLHSERIYQGKMLALRRDRVKLPNGQEAAREVVEHPGAVAIVPLNGQGEIVFVRQYRHPVGRTMLEIPAGKLQQGEDPMACARRELEEETGFMAGRLRLLTEFFTTPGFTNEKIYLFVAQDLIRTVQRPDADEFIDVESYSLACARQMIASKEIQDAKTILGVLMVMQEC